MRPRNRIAPLFRSRMAKTKGWSARKIGTGGGLVGRSAAPARSSSTADAAAAVRDQVDESRQERRPILTPERVRHCNLVLVAGAWFEPLEHLLEGDVQHCLVRGRNVERLSHLRCGFASRAGLGHAKGSANTERREEQVPGSLPQLPIHREGKVIVIPTS
jgi:hypothetical protein